MEILTLDFETYYDSDYSLSKLTYEEYIRSKLFQVILLGIQFPDGTKEIVHGTRSQMRKYLSDIDWSKYAVLCHNTMFDGAILGWHFGVKPKLWLDTLSMARAMFGNKGNSLAALAIKFGLQEKGTAVLWAKGMRYADFTPAQFADYGNYCLDDCEITRNLFQILYEGWYDLTTCDHRGKWQQGELKLIDYTLRMFTEPVLHLNVGGLQEHLARVQTAKAELLASCGVGLGDLTSNPKFAKVLESLGVDPPMKTNAKGKATYAFAKTDQGLKDLEEHENPLVQAVVAARLGTKSTLEEKRTERFIDIASRGLFPVPLKYSAARTHRWGGTDKINMQNLPARGSTNPLKNSIMAPEGYVIMDADSAQIEARILPYIAGQDDLVEDFRNKVDIYSKQASRIYNMEVNRKMVVVVDGKDTYPHYDMGFVGKTVILGAGYGTGGLKLQDTLKNGKPPVVVPLEEATRIINVYRATYPMIVALWKQAKQAIDAIIENRTMTLGCHEIAIVEGRRGIRLPNGLYLKYPGLRKKMEQKGNTTRTVYVYDGDYEVGSTAAKGEVYLHGAKLVENLIQTLARIVIGEQMLRLGKHYRPIMTVHDAIAILVRDTQDDIATAKKVVNESMTWTPTWAPGLPLNCDLGYGATYGDC